MKDAASLSDLHARAIPLTKSGGALIPVARLHKADNQLIHKLSNWRRDNQAAYPTRFEVTEKGTASWLSDRLLNSEDRILFLVQNRFGEVIGHVGLANCINENCEIEADNIVRGVNQCDPGIMTEAMQVLLKWSNDTLWPDKIFLRVFEDNHRAVGFYEKLGFHKTGRIPLKRTENGKTINYVETSQDSGPDAYFLRMTLEGLPIKDVPEKTILTAGPSIGPQEISYSIDAVRSGWNGEWAKYIKRFETDFSTYVGTKYALSTSSCTGALHIALKALGIGPGDEVIVPEITWVATANAVLYVGATPVFADVESGSWCLDPNSFERKITSKTRAVIPVHLYGHPAKMDDIMRIATTHGLYVVEDAAPSIGAKFNNQRTGSFGHFACFSFQGAKLAVTGEGGMLVTSDAKLYEKAYSIWDQGRKPGTFWIQENGLKYKMANVVAAIGLGQLQRNDAMVEAKRRIFSWYLQRLNDVPEIRLNSEMPWAHSIYWMTSIVCNNGSINTGLRDSIMQHLKSKGIDSRPVFPAISQYPIWPTKQVAEPVADYIGHNAINLPSGVCLTEREVEYICDQIKVALVRK